jgi:outer membrane protein OmpA-like peptidoglycan-associated protein
MLGAALALGLSTQAHAINLDNRLALGLGYGWAFPYLNSEFKDATDDGPIYNANLRYGLAPDTQLFVSYSNINVDYSSPVDGDLTLQPILAGIRWYPFKNTPVNPFLQAGAGVSVNKADISNVGSDDWTKFAARGGVGIEFFLTPNASLGAEGNFDYIEANEGAPLRLFTTIGSVNFYFGEADETRQAKRDANDAKTVAAANAAAADQARQETAQAQANANAAQQQAAQAQTAANHDAVAAAAAGGAAAGAAAGALASGTTIQNEVNVVNNTTDPNALQTASTASAAQQAQQAQAMIGAGAVAGANSAQNGLSVTFDQGSTALDATDTAALDQVAQVAKQYPLTRIRVEAKADAGAANANALAQKRADAVKKYLINQGVASARVQAVGAGTSTSPDAPVTFSFVTQ